MAPPADARNVRRRSPLLVAFVASLLLTASPATARPLIVEDQALGDPGLFWPGVVDAVRSTDARQLPPFLVLRARHGERRKGLARRVLHNRALHFAPGVRRSIRSGKVSSGALRLMLALPRRDGPHLVLSARANEVRIQQTTLGATVDVLREIAQLPSDELPADLGLRRPRSDYADVGGLGAASAALPEGGAELGVRAVKAALRWLGTPYSWGGGNGGGPTRGFCGPAGCQGLRTIGFDCSGLTLYAYAQVGISLDHYTGLQWLQGRHVDIDELQPGDLVFFHSDLGHVGMYVGEGKFIQAPRTGDVVKISTLSSYAHSYAGAVRPYE